MKVNIDVDSLSFNELVGYLIQNRIYHVLVFKKEILKRGSYIVCLRKEVTISNKKFKVHLDTIRKIYSTYGDTFFDNISLDLKKQVYFVKSRYDEFQKSTKELKNKYVKNIEEKEAKIDSLLKKRMEDKEKYLEQLKNENLKLDENSVTLEARISNYIKSLRRKFGYVHPKIEIEIYYPEDFKNFYYEDGIWYINFDKNVDKLYESYRKDEVTYTELMEDLKDFGDSEKEYSFVNTYDLCKEVVKVLSRAHKVYSVLYYGSPNIPKEPLVYLKKFEICENAEVDLLDDINIISPFAFEYYSKLSIAMKGIDKQYCSIQLNVSKKNKLYDESIKFLNDIPNTIIGRRTEGIDGSKKLNRKSFVVVNFEK